MSRASVLIRRAVVLPTILGLQVAIIACSPLLFLIAGLLSLCWRSSRPWRSVALVVRFALIELKTVASIGRGFDDVDDLVRQVLADCYGAMRGALAVPLVIEPGSASKDDVVTSNGLIVLARHCGPGDSIYVAWLLGIHYGLSLRVVLKRTLRLEPAINLAADRLPFCFVGGDSAAASAGIKELAAALTTGQALLLFPEGGNFTWDRWRSGLRYLAARGDRRGLRRASTHTHTLQPRPAGTLAALQAAPDADVLLLTHSGFSDDGRDREWWRVPVKRDFLARTMLHPAALVPRDEAGATAFLERSWAQVDTWVEAYADLNTPTDPSPPSEPGQPDETA